MLFVVDAAGVPSVSKIVHVDPAPDTAPALHITTPAQGATVAVGSRLTVAVDASDDSAVEKVAFSIDSTKVLTDELAPFGMTTTALFPGTYTITATATDDTGHTTTTSVVVTIVRT
jgi:chitinase